MPAVVAGAAPAKAQHGEARDPLELNVARMDEILRESTEETIRVQRIATITGITDDGNSDRGFWASSSSSGRSMR